ncbi:MAG: transposase [Candidatus Methylomirabilales bacterium]
MRESTLTVNRWTPTRKAAVIVELLRGGDAVELARRHGLSQAQLFAWRDRFLEGGRAALKTRRGQGELERDRRVRELERKVGQLTVENEVLKKTDELIRQRGRRSPG